MDEARGLLPLAAAGYSRRRGNCGTLVGVAPTAKVVHGDDLIYRFLRDLFATDAEGTYGEVPQVLLAATAIWFPPSLYAKLPVLVPFVVRDTKVRGGKDRPDEWSSPDQDGFLRDDNSIIKNIPRSLAVSASAQRHLNGRRMGTEFVASHIWRFTTDGGPLASRRPLLNSFVPNLVWLPGQIAKLTDREGSIVQRTLQAMSWSLYRNAVVEPHLVDVVEEAWSLLPRPDTSQLDSSSADWNYFVPTDRFLNTRRSRLAAVEEAAEALISGQSLPGKVISTRYTDGLPYVDINALRRLREYLGRFSEGA